MKRKFNFLEIKNKCSIIADTIKSSQNILIDILTNYESYNAVIDEIDRSLKCLRSVGIEFKYFLKPIKTISVFIPLNLPLYSLILFGIIPALLAEKVFIRPPILVREIINDIFRTLYIRQVLSDLKILELQRKDFIDKYVFISDVIIFTGKYENALQLQKNYSDKLFLFNGAGINPALVFESANIDLAVEKIIDMRIFNSGQDCAAPDAIIVHKSVVDEFLKKLKNKLLKVGIGDYRNKNNLIGKTIEDTHLKSIEKLFSKNQKNIIYGGKIDFSKKIVYPTVIFSSINDAIDKYFEFFSPIFNILEYNNEEDLDRYFQSPKYLECAMYVSIFGEGKYINKIRKSIILKDKTVLDVDEGNKPFGGYGRKTSFISYDNKVFSRPILISKEIYNYQKYRNNS